MAGKGQGCHSLGKYLDYIFPGDGKVREFCGWPGNFKKELEIQRKIREFKNYGGQSSENLFILFKRGKHVLSHEIV